MNSDNGMLEGALAMFRHGPPKTQAEIDKERERSISNGSSSWLPTPLIDLSFGKAPGDTKTDGEIVAQTSADCCVYATPGLVGCIAAADSLVTGKSFAAGLSAPFRHGPPPKESVYKAGW